ncbi:MAG: flavodoxin domain-containing protein [Bacillota bacterium]|jgi:menaquinone-dependent protoporphyrinogen oxidase|nr:flavodoxin domain-containing protein [Bacillota bacterium]HHU43943.1 hypothetical protein [Clostridiales bacterium]
MRKAIVYATKSGTCQDIALMLKDNLTNAEVFDISTETPNLANYDLVVFGGAYYAGMLMGKLRKFIKANRDLIKQRKYAFFVSCMETKNYKELLKKNVGEDLFEGAEDIRWLGYGVSVEKSKGFTKLVSKLLKYALTKENKPITLIDDNQIKDMAKKLEEIK